MVCIRNPRTHGAKIGGSLGLADQLLIGELWIQCEIPSLKIRLKSDKDRHLKTSHFPIYTKNNCVQGTQKEHE